MSKTIAQPSFSTVEKDEEYICPYDPVHRVSAKRFPIHLTKCRKIHNAKDFVRCPFNARHEVPKQELEYHISTCPDKEVIRQDMNPTPAFKPRSSNRPPTPPPTQGLFEAEEDWDCEASSESFVPANAQKFHDEQSVDSYAVVQTIHEMQNEIHASKTLAAPVDISKMTAAQKKNYKRSLKRQQKRAEEGGETEEPEMSEQERIDELVRRHHLIVDGGGFVDFISGLNIYCQQHKINTPKYREAPGVKGGFGFQVIIQTNVYQTNIYCKTKKEAKQNAAMVAMLALDIQFDAGPIPNRKNNPLTANERERMRQTHEQKLLLQSSRQSGPQQQQWNQPKPVLQPPSSYSNPPPVGNNYYTERNHSVNPPPGFENIQQPMGNLSLQSQEPADDGWTTVSKKNAGVMNPVFDYSMKVAGRGRGRPLR